MIHFAEHIDKATSFYVIDSKQALRISDTKIKPDQIDPDKKSITTWNDYLGRLKFFFRWLYNYKLKKEGEEENFTIYLSDLYKKFLNIYKNYLYNLYRYIEGNGKAHAYTARFSIFCSC